MLYYSLEEKFLSQNKSVVLLLLLWLFLSVPGKGVSFSDQKDVMKKTYISQESSESKDSMEMGNLGPGISGKSE